ncbi:MAG: L-histidine N(alpha)-methyltransferase [Proteobacteria bacterium]|nr:L-histidine N(alpha)-methyltransferase [Pseudomonadota bacterium]
MTPPALAVAFHDLEPEPSDFRLDVLAGLSKPQKELPPKYFYDTPGAKLFEAICALDEYYLTRTELEIIRVAAPEIARLMGPNPLVIEFGSGSNRKIRALLERFGRLAAYISIDISKDHLLEASRDLAKSHPGLEVIAVCADYTTRLDLPEPKDPAAGRPLGLFFGSTIGNFTPLQAHRFLANGASELGSGGAMLVGVDLKKNKAVLEAAYNDRAGVTAAFNLNLLERINRELAADFDLARFRHHAFYDEERGRIEMHLMSLASQEVTIEGEGFVFAEGETIHTENSYKFGLEQFQEMARAAGFEPARVWSDPERLFSLHYLVVP